MTPALFFNKAFKALATAGEGSSAGADRSSVNDGDQQNLPNKGFFSDARVLVRTVVTCKEVLGGAYSTLIVEDLSCFIMVKSWQF